MSRLEDGPYGVHHLPYGVFSTAEDPRRRLGVRIGEVTSVRPAGTTVEVTMEYDSAIKVPADAKAAVVAKTYEYAAHSVVKVFESSKSEYYALFDAVNSVDGTTQRVRADVNRISFPAAESLALINDSFGEIVLNGEAKIDPVRQSDPRFGLYARVLLVDAV